MRILFVFFLVSIVSASKGQVVHVNGNNNSASDGFFYTLPKTVVIADVMVRKTTYSPGPLFEYAESYLGYKGIEQYQTKYNIADIKLSTQTEADPQHIYYVETNEKQKIYAEMDELGILKRFNQPSTDQENRESKIEKEIKTQEFITNGKNLTLISLKEKSDTIFKRQILEDSVVVESRQIERVLIKSSKEESAKEAAKMINDIRQQKYKLLSYSDEITYDAKTIEVMLRELNQLEEAYFQLFLGSTQTEMLYYQFRYTPSLDLQGYQPLFKFNQNTGINDSLKLMMETAYIVFDLSPDRGSELIKKFNKDSESLKKSKSNKTGLVYRIPETVLIKIKMNNEILSQSNISINQLGTIQHIGINLLDKTKLIIDTNTGNIRAVGIN